MRDHDFDELLRLFTEELRAAGREDAPTAGAGRIAQTIRGAAGLVASAWRSRGRAGLREQDYARVAGLVKRLGRLKGIPMKVGQIAGVLETDLPEEMRRLLSLLQTQSPAVPFPIVEKIVRDDLGRRAEPLLRGMDREPVSAASIGQVHRGRLPDGQRVAVKVLHPGIEEAIRTDMSGAAAGAAFARLLLPGIGGTAREFVEEARARFLEECDYVLEAERQRLFARLFEDSADVVIPRVVDRWCGPRVLTTAWEDGRDLDSFAASATQGERDRAGKALFEVYVGTLYRQGVFHADPHPGNYRFRSDGKVIVYDFGCVRAFEPPAVAAFVALARAVRGRDEAATRSALRDLGADPPADGRAFARIHALLEGFFAPMLERGPHRIDVGIAVDLRQLAADKLAMARIRLPGSLLFLFRIRFGLYSVLARLGAECDWGGIESGWAEEARPR